MAKFIINQRVSFVSNNNIKGTIRTILKPMGGHQFYEVLKDNGEMTTVAENEIKIEVISASAWDLFAENQLKNYLDYGIITTIHKLHNKTANILSTFKSSRTEFFSYQYRPLVKYLNSTEKRILIADEVGLGKTIEAGLILLEMFGRNQLNNCLIICTKSLKEKWETEMWERFGFQFKVYQAISDLEQDLKNADRSGRNEILGIVNYEQIRNEKIENILNNANLTFDFIVCDEVHKIRNHETLIHKAIKSLNSFAGSTIFLTATPIMTKRENLFNLLTLLDSRYNRSERRIDNLNFFENDINTNRPFIKAITKLNRNEPIAEIGKELKNAQIPNQIIVDNTPHFYGNTSVENYFSNNPLFKRTINLLENGEDTLENRAKIQYDLTELNTLNSVYTRTRRKDVFTKLVKRNPRTIPVIFKDIELEKYNEVINTYQYGSLGLIMKKRQITSSVVAFLAENENDLERGDYDKTIIDSKFEEFKDKIIKPIVLENKKKIIVFSYFRKTLLYLKAKFKELAIETELIIGNDKDRKAHRDNFEKNNDIKVLLSSEVGSEGIDLQFCDTIVNYDLPWNPMVVEQRIGRIDRIGQKSDEIFIYNLVVDNENSIEKQIYNSLLTKIDIFRQTLGDLSEILTEMDEGTSDFDFYKEYNLLEIDLLTDESLKDDYQKREQRIDRVALALINQRIILDNIKEELSEAVVSDIAFQNEINSIEKNKKYLTEIELENFVESIIRNELKSCRLDKVDSDLFKFVIPDKNKSVLWEFIEQYIDKRDKNPALQQLYLRFKKEYRGETELLLTFKQEYSYNNSKFIFINSYHPFINAISNYYNEKHYTKNQCFRIALDKKFVNENNYDLSEGHYILIIYELAIKQNASNKTYLHPIMIDINGDEPNLINSKISEYILGLTQLNAIDVNEPFNFKEVEDVILQFKTLAAIHIKEKENQLLQEEKVKLDSSKDRRLKSEELFYENQIKRKQDLIKEERGNRKKYETEIESLKNEKNRRIKQIEQSEIECSNKLISVNHLQII